MDLIGCIRRGPATLGWSEMPWLMRKGAFFSALFVALLLLFIPLSIVNLGDYQVNGRHVTGPYFLTHVYPWLLPLMVLLAAIAYGYWTERLWARPLPLVFWLGVDLMLLYEVVAGDVTRGDAFSYAAWGAAYVVVAWWYCYRKETVARYYQALASARGGRMTSAGG